MSHPVGQSVKPDTPLKRNLAAKIAGTLRIAQGILLLMFSLNRHLKNSAAVLLAILISICINDYAGSKATSPEFVSPARSEPMAETTRLIVTEPKVQKKGLAVPLGVTVKNSVEGGLIVLGGLMKGTKLSAGHAVGDKNWYLFATDLNNVTIEPPHDYTGTMEVSVELLLADTAVADRRTIRYEWVEPRTAEIEPNPENTQKKEMSLKLTPDEIETLLKRGENLIASGDVTAARLVLLRPAEAGDARAAYALAKTYDRIVLEQLHAYGLTPDPALAQHWYEKARQLGATDRTALGRSATKPN